METGLKINFLIQGTQNSDVIVVFFQIRIGSGKILVCFEAGFLLSEFVNWVIPENIHTSPMEEIGS